MNKVTAANPAPLRIPLFRTQQELGHHWSKGTFLEYIKDPKVKSPGTKMAFAGIRSEKEANDFWVSQFDKGGKSKSAARAHQVCGAQEDQMREREWPDWLTAPRSPLRRWTYG
jgi:hypothetical protein